LISEQFQWLIERQRIAKGWRKVVEKDQDDIEDRRKESRTKVLNAAICTYRHHTSIYVSGKRDKHLLVSRLSTSSSLTPHSTLASHQPKSSINPSDLCTAEMVVVASGIDIPGDCDS